MSDSLWDMNRAERYLKLYGDPRDKKGSQAILCRDVASMITGKSVLDVGCGMGHLIPWLPKNAEYLGLDYSPMMLEYLRIFFPEKRVLQTDATESFAALELSAESVTSVSLLIHLPKIDDVKTVLENMWKTAIKEIVFVAETLGNREYIRKSGLTIRDISVQNILAFLDDLGIRDNQIMWRHQKMTYKQHIIVYPMQDNPMAITSPKLFQRTTLFYIQKD